MSEVTRILAATEQGNVRAVDELFPLVYQELRQLAAQRLSKELPGQTLQATALVHEAYLRLVGAEEQNWSNRRHFFSAAAEVMRRILIENARRKKSLRHGGGRKRIDLDEAADFLRTLFRRAKLNTVLSSRLEQKKPTRWKLGEKRNEKRSISVFGNSFFDSCSFCINGYC